MTKVESMTEPITDARSRELGVSAQSSKEFNGMLKDRTSGTANGIVRSNQSKVGLESWRLLCKQFNPRTLQSTLNAQELETRPKGASKMSEMPARLLEWEKNLQRCTQEGREQPRDDVKRLALLKMLPQKQWSKIWSVANKLYPTFSDLLA